MLCINTRLYCYDRSRAAAAEQRRKPEKQEKRVPVSAGVQ